MTQQFAGRVAIVTGGGSGIGEAIAVALAAAGAAVLVNDSGVTREGGAANAVSRADVCVQRILASGGRAIADRTAVGSWDAGEAVVRHALDSLGRLDILVNCAGIAALGPLDQVDVREVDRVLEVNLHGSYALMRAAWPAIASNRPGSILNMSSNAFLGYGSNAPYAASKAALVGLTLEAATEGRAVGIRANALLPLAYTRMAENIKDKIYVAWVRENLQVQHVADVALVLLDERCQWTGQLFSCGGGIVSRIVLAKGAPIGFSTWQSSALRDAAGTACEGLEPLNSGFDELAGYFKQFPPSRDPLGNVPDITGS